MLLLLFKSCSLSDPSGLRGDSSAKSSFKVHALSKNCAEGNIKIISFNFLAYCFFLKLHPTLFKVLFDKFKASSFKVKSMPDAAHIHQIQSSTDKFKPPFEFNKLKLPEFNKLDIEDKGSNIQISSNKVKAPTYKSPPTNSKLQQHSSLLQQILQAPTFISSIRHIQISFDNSKLHPTAKVKSPSDNSKLHRQIEISIRQTPQISIRATKSTTSKSLPYKIKSLPTNSNLYPTH